MCITDRPGSGGSGFLDVIGNLKLQNGIHLGIAQSTHDLGTWREEVHNVLYMSHLSFKNMYMYMYIQMYIQCTCFNEI